MDFFRGAGSAGGGRCLTNDDVPGELDISSGTSMTSRFFCDGIVHFWGQPVFAVVAETRDQRAAGGATGKITYDQRPFFTDVRSAQAAGGKLVTPPLKLERGDVEAGLASAPRRVKGAITIGGQAFLSRRPDCHGDPGRRRRCGCALLDPAPTEVQLIVAQALGIRQNAVTVNVRAWAAVSGARKQGNLFAVIAAIAAKKWNRACKIRPDRDDDMSATGKRHDFVVDYDVGYDESGKIHAVDAVYGARAGFIRRPLSGHVTDRALFHCDNAYWYPAVRARSEPLIPIPCQTPPSAGLAGRRAWWRRSAGSRTLLCARQGSARDPQGQFLWHRDRQCDALPPGGGGQYHPPRRG